MTTCFLLPDPVQSTFFIPGGNTPGNGVQVGFFLAGSSTPVTVYKDPAAAVAWSQPIVLDSGGNLPLGGEVWVPSGTTVKVTWAPSNDVFPPVSPYRTMDNLSGINDVSSSSTDWVTGPTPTFVSATSFTLAGDQRLTFNLGRRIKSTNTGGTVYSTVTSVSFAAVTTVNVVNDSGSLDAGLSAVFYGLIDPAFPSIDFYHVAKDGGTVTTAANGTTDIWGIKGTQLHITGTNAIFSFSTAAYPGATRLIIADSAFPINTSSIMSIPGGQNVTTSVGDRFQVSASTAAAAVIDWYQSNSSSQNFLVQSSGQVFAGPASGTTSALPTYRSLVGAESAFVLLSSFSVNNTSFAKFGSSDVNMTTFDEYEFHCLGVKPVNNGVVLLARVSENGGSTFNNSSTVYFNAWRGISSAGTTYLTTSASSGMNLGDTTNGQNNSATFEGDFVLKAKRLNTGLLKMFSVESSYRTNAGAPDLVDGRGTYEYSSTSAVSGVQFIYSGGSISTGTFYCYGIRKS